MTEQKDKGNQSSQDRGLRRRDLYRERIRRSVEGPLENSVEYCYHIQVRELQMSGKEPYEKIPGTVSKTYMAQGKIPISTTQTGKPYNSQGTGQRALVEGKN